MKLIIATNNAGKLKEYERMLKKYGVSVISQRAAGADVKVEENGHTFSQNAHIKAAAVYRLTQKAVVADDSGLCVDGLRGAPGVLSARYAGEGATDQQNMDKLLEAMNDIPEGKRGAQFVCSICCILPDGTELEYKGICKGKILRHPRGNRGFGYDPAFVPDGSQWTFSELTDAEKDAISHRGRAIIQLVRVLRDNYTEYFDE